MPPEYRRKIVPVRKIQPCRNLSHRHSRNTLPWAYVNTMSSLSLNGYLANYYEVPHIDMTGA